VRSIVTDELTGRQDSELEDPRKRDKVRHQIVERIAKETDVKAEEILFTDLTVQ
jgi:flagellar basal body-associated protein FliL